MSNFNKEFRKLKIVKGSIAERATKENHDLYVDFDGKKYYYKEYGKDESRKSQGITGKITSIQTGFELKGKQINNLTVRLKNNDGLFELVIGEGSPHWRHLVGKLVTADLTKEITIKPYDFVSKEMREIRGTNIYQDGKKLENKAKSMDYPVIETSWKELSKKEQKDWKRRVEDIYDELWEELAEKAKALKEQRQAEYEAKKQDNSEQQKPTQKQNEVPQHTPTAEDFDDKELDDDNLPF